MYVIDASVQVSDFNAEDVHHEATRRLLQMIEAHAIPVVCPEILLPEVASAVARATDNSDLGQQLARTLRQIPHYQIVPVDEELANLASDLAARYRIRGCDAIYVAVAYRLSIKLITWDKEQRARAAQVVAAVTPSEEAALIGSIG
jgi:predicted nucleic acid-binding protein